MQGAGDVSVEEILASIKRVIGRDAPRPVAPPTQVHEPVEPADADEADEVRELAEDHADQGTPPVEAPLTGANAAEASRAAFASLQALAGGGAGGALDAQVQLLLRPMLAEWLDAHLPDIVDRLVRAEIARITSSHG